MERTLEVEELKDKFFGGLKRGVKYTLEKLFNWGAVAPSDTWIEGTEISGSTFSSKYRGRLEVFRGLVKIGVLERRSKHPFEYRVANPELAKEILDYERKHEKKF